MQAPPSSEELLYAYHDRGFALVSTRSPDLQRMYIQCDPNDDIANWSDEMILEELQARLATTNNWQLRVGAIIQKSILAMRSFVIEPRSMKGEEEICYTLSAACTSSQGAQTALREQEV